MGHLLRTKSIHDDEGVAALRAVLDSPFLYDDTAQNE